MLIQVSMRVIKEVVSTIVYGNITRYDYLDTCSYPHYDLHSSFTYSLYGVFGHPVYVLFFVDVFQFSRSIYVYFPNFLITFFLFFIILGIIVVFLSTDLAL